MSVKFFCPISPTQQIAISLARISTFMIGGRSVFTLNIDFISQNKSLLNAFLKKIRVKKPPFIIV